MTTDSRKIQLETGVDASGAKAGFQQVKDAAKEMATSVAQSGVQASKGLDGVADAGKKAADGFTREEGRLRSAVQRATLDLKTLGKTASEKFEAKIEIQGLDAAKFAPYLTQLKALETQAQQSAANTTRALGVSAGQTANAFRQLPAQLTDVVTQLAGGQNPLLILVQQGGQVKDSFGGIGNALKAVGSLISPLTVAAVGLGAGFAGLGVAAAHAEGLQRSLNGLEAQLTATGRAGLFSTDDLKKFSNELALAPGVTRDAAAVIIGEFTKVHSIGSELFKDLARSAVDYAKATGTDVPTAAKILAKAFDDPIKGAKSLDDALGTLSTTQLLQIENLVKANDLAGAQRALYDALQVSIKDLATNAMTPLQKATNDLGNAWEKTMQAFDKSDGLKNATGAVGVLLGRLTQFVAYLPEFEQKWKGAFTGGLNGMALRLAGFDGKGKAGSSQFLGNGATGSWDEPAASTTRTAATGGTKTDDDIKRALELGKAFQGQADKIADLSKTRKVLNDAMAQSIALYGKESEQAQKLKGQIAGVDDAIKTAQKKLAGPVAKAYTDDAATKMLENLRQQEASLKDQLSANDKLTASEKELAKFVQLTLDLKSKGQLTADQKSLLASQDAIKAQLQQNVAVEQQLVLKEQLAKRDKEALDAAKNLSNTFEGINLSLASAGQGRRDQYERTLATAGLGDRARRQVDEQRAIREEARRAEDQATKAAAKAKDKDGNSLLNSEGYKDEVAKIRASLDQNLAGLADFYEKDAKNRGNWLLGAQQAFANYNDEATNAAKHTEEAFTNALKGLEDQFTNLFTGKKFDLKKLIGDTQADLTRNFVKENITGPLSKLAGDAIGDGGLLSGLLGSSKKGGERGASAANPLFVRLADALGLTGGAGAGGSGGGLLGGLLGGSGSSGGGLLGLLGSAAGSFGGTAAQAGLANALPGDSLDNLFKLTSNFKGFANGGSPPVGKISMVGERGPELFVPKQAGTIIPSEVLAGMGQQRAPVINIAVEGQVTRKTSDQIASKVGMEIRRSNRNA